MKDSILDAVKTGKVFGNLFDFSLSKIMLDALKTEEPISFILVSFQGGSRGALHVPIETIYRKLDNLASQFQRGKQEYQKDKVQRSSRIIK